MEGGRRAVKCVGVSRREARCYYEEKKKRNEGEKRMLGIKR